MNGRSRRTRSISRTNSGGSSTVRGSLFFTPLMTISPPTAVTDVEISQTAEPSGCDVMSANRAATSSPRRAPEYAARATKIAPRYFSISAPSVTRASSSRTCSTVGVFSTFAAFLAAATP